LPELGDRQPRRSGDIAYPAVAGPNQIFGHTVRGQDGVDAHTGNVQELVAQGQHGHAIRVADNGQTALFAGAIADPTHDVGKLRVRGVADNHPNQMGDLSNQGARQQIGVEAD
jgi:hypothetical protein